MPYTLQDKDCDWLEQQLTAHLFSALHTERKA